MSLRPFRMPADLTLMTDLLPQTFHYPENPEWSVQADEQEGMLSMVNAGRRLWPLIAVMQKVSPTMRDILHGFIWEEDGKPVGLVNVSRDGASDDWVVSNVAVLPAYRRRGIARKLVEAAVNLTREHHAHHVLLDVVAGNTPAYDLYLSLGFVHCASNAQMRHAVPNVSATPSLADNYTATKVSATNWQPSYELARRITPEEVQVYRPVTEQHFRPPASMRLFFPLFTRLSGVQEQGLLVHTAANTKQIVATMRLSAHIRGTGINSCTVLLDPAHGELAPYLAQYAVQTLQRLSPKNRIEWSIPLWEPALIEAAQASEFTQASIFHMMGMKL